ncbi:MAG: hypothetical protein AAF466_01535 [Bacteroidota bacterium]
MKKTLFLCLIALSVLACKSNDDDTNTTNDSFVPPNATIKIEDLQQTPIEGTVVYTFKAQTWNTNGNDPDFADRRTTTNAQGETSIELDFSGLFGSGNTERFYFSIHYRLNNEERTQFVSLVFMEGEDKSATITLPFVIAP